MLGFNRVISLVRARLSAISVAAVPSETYIVPGSDLYGNVFTRNVVLDVGGIPVDTQLATPAVQVPPTNSTTNISFLYALNAIGFEENLVVIPDNANGQAPHITGMLGVVARLQAFNPITGFYDRAEIEGDNLDGLATSVGGHLSVKSHNAVFNGTSWDRQRANQDIVVLPPAVYAATTNSADITNYSSKGALFVLDVTAVPGVSTVTFKLQGKDIASGKYYDIETATVAKAAIGTYTYAVYPALFNDTVSGFTSNMTGTNGNVHIPRIFRVQIVHTGAGNFTYSVGASMST